MPLAEDDPRRVNNVEGVNRGLYEMHDAGALPHFTHRTEPRRDGAGTADVWELTFPRPDGRPEDRSWTYRYADVRALLRGWKLGKRYG